MPRVHRRRKNRRRGSGWDVIQVRYLRNRLGKYRGHVPFETPAEMRRCWQEIGDELLADWIEQKPLTRPWAWWEFDAPELRRRIDGKPHPFDDPERAAHIAEMTQKHGTPAFDEKETYYGVPAVYVGPNDFTADFETEAAYLLRLGLANDDEKRLYKSYGEQAAAVCHGDENRDDPNFIEGML